MQKRLFQDRYRVFFDAERRARARDARRISARPST